MCASLADDVVFPAPLGPNIRNNTGAVLEVHSNNWEGRGLALASSGREACKKVSRTNRKKDKWNYKFCLVDDLFSGDRFGALEKWHEYQRQLKWKSRARWHLEFVLHFFNDKLGGVSTDISCQHPGE
jgi:hypothetical protein